MVLFLLVMLLLIALKFLLKNQTVKFHLSLCSCKNHLNTKQETFINTLEDCVLIFFNYKVMIGGYAG